MHGFRELGFSCFGGFRGSGFGVWVQSLGFSCFFFLVGGGGKGLECKNPGSLRWRPASSLRSQAQRASNSGFRVEGSHPKP